MSEHWYVIRPWEDRMAAISETPDGISGALAYVGRQSRDIDADAALIAAAPEMLAAIESLNTLLNASDLEKDEARWDDAMEEVEAELARVAAKARGESRQ